MRTCTWLKPWYAKTTAIGEHPDAEDEVRGAVSRDVEHRDEHGEEQERRPQVLLQHHDHDRDRPGHEQWPEVLRIRQVHPPDAPAPGRQQLALLDEVRGEEDDQQDLRGLTRLHGEGTDAGPQAGVVDLDADARYQGQHQCDDAEQQERVLVAGERADVAHERQREDEGGDADRRPHRLRRSDALRGRNCEVQPRDRHEADAQEGGDEGEQGRVGVGGEPADGDVRDHEEGEDRDGEGPEIGRERGRLGQGEEHVARQDDDQGEDPEAELLGPAPVADDAHRGVWSSWSCSSRRRVSWSSWWCSRWPRRGPRCGSRTRWPHPGR